MTTNKCPKCGHNNSDADNFCLNCGVSLVNLMPPPLAPLAAQQSPQSFQSYKFNVPDHFNSQPGESVVGQRVLFWYRIFTFLFAIAFLPWVVLGAMAIAGGQTLPEAEERANSIYGGLVLVLFGLGVFLPYIIGTFSPPKAWHWVYGIILILMSMTTCVAFPFALPLFIYWINPETKAFFGRKF